MDIQVKVSQLSASNVKLNVRLFVLGLAGSVFMQSEQHKLFKDRLKGLFDSTYLVGTFNLPSSCNNSPLAVMNHGRAATLPAASPASVT